MDLEEGTADGSKRLSEPFFLKKILIEKAGDTSDLTTLATSVHAVMLGSGFVLLNSIIMAALIGLAFQMIELLSLSLRNRFVVPGFDLVMDTLKFEKQASSSSYRESGLELPPCLMRLPTEPKLKILELISGTSIANMACVCTEMRHLVASDDGLRKRRAWKKLLAATSTP
ncbi:hypothetical protein F2Q70_00010577 [Brassica cretica]|uniref:F-box domain-containing protein n=1 Tax=Brassica cretica TaxID=69181 RepID=A0A8S9J5J3_BRACR|nr:hypothetical protein F2Q68_00003680 [Brassica cretica]KAF2616319.1 hypothetical protein F2Q70_00010577 [Brassica cretica]